MVEIKQSVKKTVTSEGRGFWIKDDIDRMIDEILVESQREMTFTQIKNGIYSRVFERFAKEKLIDRLNRLCELGILEHNQKLSNIMVFKTKK